MGTDLAVRSSEVPAAFTEQMHMATVLADSSLLPAHLRGKPANVLVVLQGARALDVSAFWAFQSMHVVEGKLSLSAELMRALVIRAGHKVRIVERSMNRAVVEIHRSDRPEPYRAEFTWDDAKAAKLDTKTNWTAYRKSMLVARATTIAVRDECPDVMFGVVYSPEELGAITDEDGNPVVGRDGKITMEGETVEPLTEQEIAELAESLAELPLGDLPAAWTLISERGAQFTKVAPGSDETLTDHLGTRLALEATLATHKAQARELWEMANLLRLGEVSVIVDGAVTDLRAHIKAVGATLPDEAPPEAAPGPALVLEPEPEPPAATGVVVDAEVVDAEVIDTEHAAELRAAAEASWAEGQQANATARDKVFNDLRKAQDAAAAARAKQQGAGSE